MKKISFFALAAIMPLMANAAGTYYNTGYRQNQSQSRYNSYNSYSGQSSSGGFAKYQGSASSYKRGGTTSANSNAAYNTRSGYNTAQSSNRYNAQNSQYASRTQSQTKRQSATQTKNGFWLDAGISHEFANWQFEMKNAGSILHYDNIAWNVLDVRGGYVFDLGSKKGQIDVGFKYGMQSGENTMIDDDITNGGYLSDVWELCRDTDGDGDCDSVEDAYQIGHALSIGKSSGGNMMDFHAGFSLKDFFKIGNLKITPSIGYRYLKYTLETKNNHGLAIDTAGCIEFDGEMQCDPAVIFQWVVDGKVTAEGIVFRDTVDEWLTIPEDETLGNPNVFDTAGTYYYEQYGVTHSYDVTWAGPYIAMDMDYQINQNNAVNGRVELGLPGYTATGDQPYRFDWQHPKSVEDKTGMFGAMHFGLGANYVTALTNTVSLSIGFTFDYYSVGGADANTYLNPDYYMGIYDELLRQWEGAGYTEQEMLNGGTNSDGAFDPDPQAVAIKELQDGGWVVTDAGEIDSFYKSMGIRVGINAKF